MTHDLTRSPLLALACCIALAAGQLAFAPEASADEGRVRTYVSRDATATTRTTVQSPRLAAAPAAPRRARTVRRVAEPRTAVQLAAIQGLSYSDMRAYVLLSGATLRVRLYPGSNVVSVAGREYQLKDRIVRSGSEIQLTSRVSRFLQTKIYAYRSAERQRKAIAVAPKPKLEPLPPLPERRRIVKKIPKVDVKPAARPAPARDNRRAAKAGAGWAPSVKERNWKWVILHHSDTEEGDMAKYDDYHRNVKRWENGCGYHFVIGNGTLSGDGEVEIGPRWEAQLQGAHAKVPGNRYNEQGVGICLVGDFDEASGRPSASQMDALVNLLRWLSQRYNIDSADIMGHCDCCSTCCPGKNFPWAELRRRIQ